MKVIPYSRSVCKMIWWFLLIQTTNVVSEKLETVHSVQSALANKAKNIFILYALTQIPKLKLKLRELTAFLD